MAGLALRLLLAACGTAHAARQAVVATHNATAAARHNASLAKHNATASGAAKHNATDPGVEHGGLLTVEDDEYILEWSESAASWSLWDQSKAVQNDKWYFITPVMCRRTGIWYKLKMESAGKKSKCLLVKCNLDGGVEKVEPREACFEFTNKVLRTHGPYMTRSSDWSLWHIPRMKQMSAIDTSKAVSNGWSFDTRTVKRTLKKEEPRDYFDFYAESILRDDGWDFSRQCKHYKSLWEDAGAMFTNAASLEVCKEKRTAARESCVGKYQLLVGTATAWQVKQLLDWKKLQRLPSCNTWCSKNDCFASKAPEGVKRDTEAFMAAMNSWKYACEQELDAFLLKRVEACKAIGKVCDLPWKRFKPCAETYSLPYYH